VDVQGRAVGHIGGVGDADGLGVISLGVGAGLGGVVSDGDGGGDGDGDSAAIDGRGGDERRPWMARATLPAARMRMEAGIAQRRGC
jgi:hypothetical protein